MLSEKQHWVLIGASYSIQRSRVRERKWQTREISELTWNEMTKTKKKKNIGQKQ